MGSLGLEAGLSAEGLSFNFNACLWRPSFTYKGNIFDISLSANVGYCREYSFSTRKKTITIGFITISINAKDDEERSK